MTEPRGYEDDAARRRQIGRLERAVEEKQRAQRRLQPLLDVLDVGRSTCPGAGLALPALGASSTIDLVAAGVIVGVGVGHSRVAKKLAVLQAEIAELQDQIDALDPDTDTDTDDAA